MSSITRAERTVSSMLWSAWADALGWISELTSSANLVRRTKGRELTEPFEWSRTIGGRVGVRVDLPAGCYSDDTQLRLATARSISGYGFDVEAFSRVELPVWQAYALGGGRASKTAAGSMARANANWAANFYPGWEQSGGNGAAMRIQPHVFAEPHLSSFRHLDDVIRNAVVSHGHPRAIAGAVFHAVSLTITLDEARVPGPGDWSRILDVCHTSVDVFSRHLELVSYWRPRWEETSKRNFEEAWHEAVHEIETALRASEPSLARLRTAGRDRGKAAEAYEELVHVLKLADKEVRGSAITTTVAALILASAFPDHPAKSAQLAASRLNTDTDTIATMAAAIVGAASPIALTSPLQDEEYIRYEAERLASIAEGSAARQFSYPDLLNWSPPKSGLDSVGLVNNRLALAGMGWLEPLEQKEYEARDSVWQWMQTSFGQTVLLKRRAQLRTLSVSNLPTDRESFSFRPVARVTEQNPQLFDYEEIRHSERAVAGHSSAIDVSQILTWLSRQAYKDENVGYALKRIVQLGTPEQLEQFVAAISKQLGSRKM